jgi:hypothetical protein
MQLHTGLGYKLLILTQVKQYSVPASTMIPGVYAFTDASSDPWFAPAGITRGGLGQVIRAERKLTA